MKILVTGAAGFIGSNLVDGLLAAGHELRALDNFSTGHRANLDHVAADVDVVEGDLRSYERVSWAVRGCEAVFHEGAMPSVPRSVQDPLTSSEINIGGTLNVLLGTVVTGATATALYGGYGYGYHQDAAVNGRARPAAPPPRPAGPRPEPQEIPPTVTERLRKRGENGAEVEPPKKPGLPHKPPERKKSGWFS